MDDEITVYPNVETTHQYADLIGLIVADVMATDDTIDMWFADGSKAQWYHSQECCESVTIEDMVGDWQDLIGHPLLVAEERTSERDEAKEMTWTFYTFRGVGGSVDVRWCGSSNGYYSENVYFSFTPASEANK